MTEDHQTPIMLPVKIATSADLGKALRELEQLDDFLHQSTIRSGGKPVNLPRTTRMLEDLAIENRLSLLDEKSRAQLLSMIHSFYKKYPKIHMSFTVEPSASFVEKIIIWLRRNIHTQMIIDIGLQPTIAAGCVIRTPNKIFDLSLRNNLSQKRQWLVDRLGEDR